MQRGLLGSPFAGKPAPAGTAPVLWTVHGLAGGNHRCDLLANGP